MKKLLFTIIALALISGAFAQTPDAFKYQAVARGTSGNVLENQNVSLRISIQQGVAHNDVYVETHDATTNAFGLFNLEIGNGTLVSGDFATIDWSLGSYYIQIEMDENGGTNYQLMGVSPLLSVPYAMHSKTADNVFSGNYNDLTNTPDLSNYDSNVADDFSGNYSDLTGTPTLNNVAISGSYNDLNDKPVMTGDVTGATDNTTVEKIQGMSISSNIPANGQILKWNATNQIWEPSEDALGAAGTTDGVVSSGSVSGTTTKTLTLQRTNGLGDITITFTDEVDDADADATNELQSLSLSGTNLTISNGNTIDLGIIQDGTGTDSQHLTLTGTVLSIDNGNSVDLAALAGATDTDDQTLTLTGNILSIADGNSVDLSAFMDNTDTQLTEAEVDSYVSNNGYLTSEVDGSVTNEIQDLVLTGTTLKISNNPTATEIDLSPFSGTNTDEQTLTLTGNNLAISNGNSVDLSAVNTDSQSLSLSGSNLSISGGNSVDLSSLAGTTDTDDQTLNLSGTTLSIADGNSVDLSSIDTDTQLSEVEVDAFVSNNGYLTSEVDGSVTNEIQDISLSGTNLSITSGSTIDLSSIDTDTHLTEAEVDAFVGNNGYLTSFAEVDGSTTNEIQDLVLTGSTLKITNNPTATEIDLSPFSGTNTDEQTLSLSGNTISISNGNSVDLSGIAGTDTDDQTLSLSGTVLTISDGNSVNLDLIDTDTQLSEAEVDAYVGNNGYLTSFTEVDGSITNEIQDLSLSGNTLSLSGDATTVNLASYLDNTDSQSLTLSGSSLSISNGNTVNLSAIDTKLTEAEVDAYVNNNGYLTSFTEVDGSTTNEIQDLSLSGNTLSLSGDATTINLTSYLDNTDSQSLTLSGSSLSISNGNTVDLSSLGGGADTDDQTLSLSGTTLSIADGNSVNLSSINTDDQTLTEILTANPSAGFLRISQVNIPADDWDVANKYYVDNRYFSDILTLSTSAGYKKITDLDYPAAAQDAANKGYVDSKIPASQTLSLSGSNLTISDGNTVDLSSLGGADTDDQTLSLSGTTLSIADGNSVDLSSIDTKLTEVQVDAYVSNNGYLTSESDGSTTNELQSLSLSGTNLTISSGNTVNLSSIDTKLTEAQVDAYVSNNGYLTSFTEVDGSTSNELQSLSLSGTNLTISSGNTISLSSLGGTDDQTLSEVLTQGTDAGNKNIVNVAKLGVGTSSVNASAAAEVNSTTGGFLLPRMTTTQRDAIASPVAGLTVFNTTTSKFQGYTGAPVNEYDAENISIENTSAASSTLEQTYVATKTGSLNQLELYLWNTATSNVYVQIYQGTTLIGTSNTVSVSGTGVQIFSFSGVSITTGTTYKYRLVAASTVSWYRSNANYYAAGAGYVNSVAQSWDFYFRQSVTISGGWVDLH